MAAEESFLRLKNVDTSFQERSNFVFANLDDLEPKVENPEPKAKDKNMAKKRRTRLPNRVPDHVLSPEKWTKYSLKVDGSENLQGMNRHNINKYAAHTFLEELRQRKSQGTKEITKELPSDDTKISFQKPSSNEAEHGSGKGVWKDGTFVMPEYTIGSSQPKKRKRSGVQPSAGCAVKVSLDHLGGDGEEENTQEVTEMNKVKGKRKRVLRKRKVDQDDQTNDTKESERKTKGNKMGINE